MNRLFLLAIPLVLLLIVPLQSALAWDFGSWLGGLGFHHWGGLEQFGCGAYCQGERDATYDHDNNLVYNPYPQCCHSEYYQQAFHEGYDQQWNTYQNQQSNQRSNIYINNSPGAYVSTTQNSNQGQSQEQGPTWTSPDNINGDCSNGCSWGQGP